MEFVKKIASKLLICVMNAVSERTPREYSMKEHKLNFNKVFKKILAYNINFCKVKNWE